MAMIKKQYDLIRIGTVNLKYNASAARWEIHHSLTDPASNWREVWEWCWRTFGHPGTDPKPGVKSLWDYHGRWFYFYDEKCVTMFVLKWSWQLLYPWNGTGHQQNNGPWNIAQVIPEMTGTCGDITTMIRPWLITFSMTRRMLWFLHWNGNDKSRENIISGLEQSSSVSLCKNRWLARSYQLDV